MLRMTIDYGREDPAAAGAEALGGSRRGRPWPRGLVRPFVVGELLVWRGERPELRQGRKKWHLEGQGRA